MFKNYDAKHIGALIACALIVGAFALVPSIHAYQGIALSVAAPLFIYAGIALPQAGLGGAAAKPEDK